MPRGENEILDKKDNRHRFRDADCFSCGVGDGIQNPGRWLRQVPELFRQSLLLFPIRFHREKVGGFYLTLLAPRYKKTIGTAFAMPIAFHVGWEMGFEPTIFSATN